MIKEFNGFHYNEANVLSRDKMMEIIGGSPCNSTGCTSSQIDYIDNANPNDITSTQKDNGVEYSYSTESGNHTCCRVYQ